MANFNNYKEILNAVISQNITTIDEFLKRTQIKCTELSNFDLEQYWIKNQVEATYASRERLIIVRADLMPLVKNKAILHESGHILLGHVGNYLLSSTPVSGSNIEHSANMVSYVLLLWFAYCEHSDEITQTFLTYDELAVAYEIPADDIDYLKDAFYLVHKKITKA
ncbi:hypothetical protein [Pediococcus pentosaceus]|uniref:hypothetical protein n=1 Tax=Pediococcus pentosaceus TaxID=1255 RepID=UPI003981FF39